MAKLHRANTLYPPADVAISPSLTVRNYCYFFGGGRTLQVVKEQDAGHDPGAELQTGQNTTVQAHPHFPLQAFPLNVWPFSTVAIVER
jgi:hypothetical protein